MSLTKRYDPSCRLNDSHDFHFISWDNALHITASSDFINWDGDRVLAGSVDGTRAWYPTVMSDAGNNIGGANMNLYYADRFAYPDIRHVAKRYLSFSRSD